MRCQYVRVCVLGNLDLASSVWESRTGGSSPLSSFWNSDVLADITAQCCLRVLRLETLQFHLMDIYVTDNV